MKVVEASFIFKAWEFYFVPAYPTVMSGRNYITWHVIIIRKGVMYQTFYTAFVPSAKICRRIKSNKHYSKV
jgi:hypothetical protein